MVSSVREAPWGRNLLTNYSLVECRVVMLERRSVSGFSDQKVSQDRLEIERFWIFHYVSL